MKMKQCKLITFKIHTYIGHTGNSLNIKYIVSNPDKNMMAVATSDICSTRTSTDVAFCQLFYYTVSVISFTSVMAHATDIAW